jgi:hypothetical protein
MLAILYCILSISTTLRLFFYFTAFKADFHDMDGTGTACLSRDSSNRLILQVAVKPAYNSNLTNKVNQEILRRNHWPNRSF